MLSGDYDRKHAELIRTIEVRDELEGQMAMLSQHLGQLTNDRRRIERELERVQHNLRTNTDLADEVSTEISHVREGIKDSVEQHMGLSTRLEPSMDSMGSV